jgi:hypothetical protein
MKKILLAALILTSANARWESTHLKNGDLVLFNNETGQAYYEFLDAMIPLAYTTGTEMVEDSDGKKFVSPKFPAELIPPAPKKK